jgi:cytochrome c oxidase assembly protein Cox11
MSQNQKYLIPIFLALVCLMYQAMPIHKLFSTDSAFSLSLIEEDDNDTEKENQSSKKIKSEIDNFITSDNVFLFVHQLSNTIYYFHHLPKSYEVKSVFAPPPELV